MNEVDDDKENSELQARIKKHFVGLSTPSLESPQLATILTKLTTAIKETQSQTREQIRKDRPDSGKSSV
jgi:hypothetical protein